ncbi:MAG: hypothetical protein R3E42_03235 [Burkholderiaceae bacterium]
MVTSVTLDIALAFEPEERAHAAPAAPPREPLITPLLLLRIVYVSALMVGACFGCTSGSWVGAARWRWRARRWSTCWC